MSNPINALSATGLLTQEEIIQRAINPTQDALRVDVRESQASAAPSSDAIATANATVATLAAGERLCITNLSTSPLCVKRGASASATSFHYILAAAVAQDDGTGGFIEISDHIGAVSVYSADPRFNAWKITK